MPETPSSTTDAARDTPETSVPPSAARTIRVGAVSYTNTRPLIDGLHEADLQADFGFSLRLATPAKLAGELERGDLDVALISVAAFLNGDYRLVSGGCIGCLGRVLSVRLFAQEAIERVGSIVLDPASRSANALTRLLAKHLWSIDPAFVAPAAPDGFADGKGAGDFALGDFAQTNGVVPPARLLIGDPALHRLGSAPREYDLGEAWQELTQLPFVFAVWAARPDVDLRGVPALLDEARRRGLERLPVHAAEAAAHLGLPESLLREYLGHHIRYELGDSQLVAIEMFYRMLRDEGLARASSGMRYYEPPAA